MTIKPPKNRHKNRIIALLDRATCLAANSAP
jgi:hypothetical protein